MAADLLDRLCLTRSGHPPGTGVARLFVATLLALAGPVGALHSHPAPRRQALKTVARDRVLSTLSGAGLLSRCPKVAMMLTKAVTSIETSSGMRLITALILMMFFPIGPAAAEGWKEYSYSDYSFSVSFPANPKMETTSYQDANGRSAEAHVYSVAQGNAVLKMKVVDLPDASDESTEIARAMRTLAMRGEIKFTTR